MGCVVIGEKEFERHHRKLEWATRDLHVDLGDLALVAGQSHHENLLAQHEATSKLVDIERNMESVAEGVWSLADISSSILTVVGGELPAIRAAAEILGNQVAEVGAVLRAPLRTRGVELLSRASLALSNQWWDDAERDALAAIDGLPFELAAWAILGHARNAMGNHGRAGDAFERGARYAGPVGQSIAAGFALLSADAYRRGDDVSGAVRVLRAAKEVAPNCPSLLVALAVHSGDIDVLAKALALDPSCAIDARLSGLPVDEAAGVALAQTWHPLAIDARHALDAISDIAQRVGVDASKPQPIPPYAASVAALMATAADTHRTRAGVRRVIEEVERVAASMFAPPSEPVWPADPGTRPVRPTPPEDAPSLFASARKRSDYRARTVRYEEESLDYEYLIVKWREAKERYDGLTMKLVADHQADKAFAERGTMDTAGAVRRANEFVRPLPSVIRPFDAVPEKLPGGDLG